MLHGYAQNGDTFRRKTSKLVESIRESYPDAQFCWPDGPIELRTSDIPGFGARSYGDSGQDGPRLRAWFHLRYVANPPSGLSESLTVIADLLQRDGPFDGVVAFSQGTLLAGMVASLLDGEGREAAHRKASNGPTIVFPYPLAFRALEHPPFKFGVFYATRVGQGQHYQWLYDNPKISTPFCLVSGRWDPMVEAEEHHATVGKLSNGRPCLTLEHAGGHFVPTDCQNIRRVLDFIRGELGSRPGGSSVGPCHTLYDSKAIDPIALVRCLQKIQSAIQHDCSPKHRGAALRNDRDRGTRDFGHETWDIGTDTTLFCCDVYKR